MGLAVLGGAPAAASAAFTPGARSLGDSLFPTIGNGGYDVRHYDLDLDYAVAKKRLEGTATIDAVATQGLSRFSFDLTAWNKVRSVSVDGRPARFVVDAKRSKLTITPRRGIRDGRRFRVVVRYGGIQRPLKGTTSLKEGWIPDAKTGAVVVAQPVGAMGWYPNNNVPADKATYTTRITVPRGWSALATGVLTSRRSGRARQEHVRVEGDRPDVDLPRVRLGRQVRRQLAQPGQAGQDQARRREPEQAGAVLHRDHRRRCPRRARSSRQPISVAPPRSSTSTPPTTASATRSRRWAGS